MQPNSFTSSRPLLIRALRGETIPRYPVWLMRQAGRYMPEYRALKEKHGFLTMCKTPELAAEVTLQPIRYLDADAAILFSDILMPAEGMGFSIDFAPGPIIHNPIKAADDVSRIKASEPMTATPYVMDTLRHLKPHLATANKALIGFAGTPWTLACYLIHQGPFKHFAGTVVFAKRHPQAFSALLEKLSAVVTDYLLAQHESGADVVQLFDSWGGNLSIDEYRHYSLPSIVTIVAALKKRGCPVIVYVGNGAHLLHALKDVGATAISIDWRTEFSDAEKILGATTAIQGNLDPASLFGATNIVTTATLNMLNKVKRQTRFIANLGHGVLSETPPENVRAFVDTVRAFSLIS